MTNRLASCSCGKLTVSTQGEPTRVSVCHCLACQRRSGSVFATQARFPADAVTIEGQSTEYVRVGDEGTSARFTSARFAAPLSSICRMLSQTWWPFPSAPSLTRIFRSHAHRSMRFANTVGWAFLTTLSTLIERPVVLLMVPDNSFQPKPLRGSA